MTTRPTPVDPTELHYSPAFSHGMIAPAGPTLYVGGQNGTDNTGALLDGLGEQTEQALQNVFAVLREAGTDPEHVVKLTIYLASGVDPEEAYAATRSVWGNRRTAVTVLAVTPARPGALVEIEAVATLPRHSAASPTRSRRDLAADETVAATDTLLQENPQQSSGGVERPPDREHAPGTRAPDSAGDDEPSTRA